MNYKFDNGAYPKGDKAVSSKKVNNIKLIGKIATITCIGMYVSYIPEIISNFSGNPVSPWQPLVAMINGCLWTYYGWKKTYTDWPIIISNIPGVLFGFITVLTVYVH